MSVDISVLLSHRADLQVFSEKVCDGGKTVHFNSCLICPGESTFPSTCGDCEGGFNFAQKGWFTVWDEEELGSGSATIVEQ